MRLFRLTPFITSCFCLLPLNHPRCFFSVLSLIFPDWEPLKSIYIMSLFLLVFFSSCSSVIFQVNLVYIYLQRCERLYQMLSPIFFIQRNLITFPLKDQGRLGDISQFLHSFSEAVLYCALLSFNVNGLEPHLLKLFGNTDIRLSCS